MNNYTFVKLEEGNIKDLYHLFEAVYGKTAPKNYFHLKYNTVYTGISHLGFLAYQNAVPVAYYGIIPTFVSITKQAVLAAQSCDTMTHPAHQKKGLFTTLAKQTFEYAKQKGIHFVFGFPNQNSYPGFIKYLGFSHSDTMNRYTVRLSNTPFKLLYRKLGLTKVKAGHDSITNTLLQEGYDGLLYDKNYINYKRYNPNAILEKKGELFWVNSSKGTWIGAVYPIKKESFRQSISLIETLTKGSSLTFMTSPGTQLDVVLSKITPAEKGFAVITKNLSGKYDLSKLKFQFGDIDIF